LIPWIKRSSSDSFFKVIVCPGKVGPNVRLVLMIILVVKSYGERGIEYLTHPQFRPIGHISRLPSLAIDLI
jgi:hypothetical protein